MKNLYINVSDIETTFSSLKSECQGDLRKNNTEIELSLNDTVGNGKITGFQFNNHILYLTYEVSFNEDTTLVFQNKENEQSLNYCYCSAGEIRHSFGDTGKKVRFSEIQTGIFSNSVGKASHLYFQKNQHQKFTIISFIANKPFSETTDEFTLELMQLFKSQEVEGKFAYVSSHNIKIQYELDKLESPTEDNIAKTILKKGALQLSLGMIVNQYFEDVKSSSVKSSVLSQNELKRIKEISDFIKNYPDRQFDLNFLSEKTGLTPAKLQQGFKALFGRTVSNFIKNVRVELAEKLIKTTDLNISEIVYTIGLSSRSYFSKIFKEKYKCSPKEYQDNKITLRMLA
ncbi:AraC family transcriptional regulator [Tenacibaculum adriaticum]|uniref:AraC family transcriptional regulator n=1 Tax=Tenacibaculum adriaticum TaxID=413713 RepID=A0A5S5DQE7_9FLAO|nr:AraC family transcriptional regulator [Tenacibaculum adriaticum]TYP98180.1 AraC family transcriptional regulator [Tenacibaculum adriaticum]